MNKISVNKIFSTFKRKISLLRDKFFWNSGEKEQEREIIEIYIDEEEKNREHEGLFQEYGIKLSFIKESFKPKDVNFYYTDLQKEMIKKGFLEEICLFSGKKRKTQESFGDQFFCYYGFVSPSGHKFWVILGSPPFRSDRMLLIKLSRKKFIKICRFRKRDKNIFLYKKSIEGIHNFLDRIDQSEVKVKKKKAIIIGYPQFFHFVFNELTALNKLYKEGVIDDVDKIFVLDDFFDLKYIFPDMKNKFELIRKEDLAKLSDDYFIIRPGSRYVDDDLVVKIHKYSETKTPLIFKEKFKDFRDKHKIILVISIRSGLNKIWSKDDEGIANIINRLNEQYEDIGIIIDGFSVTPSHNDDNKIYTRRSRIIKTQNELVEKILSTVKKTDSIWNTVGCSIYETIFLSKRIDTYFTTHGSVQHKWGWFGNRPGVVHGPKARMVFEESKNKNNAAYVLKDPVFCLNIPSDEVVDIKDESREGFHHSHNDYQFGWELAYERVAFLIEKVLEKRERSVEEWNKFTMSYNHDNKEDNQKTD